MDPSADFLDVVDFLEPVTLVRRGGEPVAVAHALRRTIRTQEAASSNAACTRSDVTWHWSQTECDTCPRLGDAIVDGDGRRWTVLAIEESQSLGQWSCTCRDLVLVHRLDDTISIEQAEYTKGDGGAATVAWQTWRTGIRARIQPKSAQVDQLGQALQTVRQFQVFVADGVTVDHTHRIRAADGTVYRVCGSTKAQRLDELQVIEVEQEP
jgi:hypothetical protein